jgi:hypothetical protein
MRISQHTIEIIIARNNSGNVILKMQTYAEKGHEKEGTLLEYKLRRELKPEIFEEIMKSIKLLNQNVDKSSTFMLQDETAWKLELIAKDICEFQMEVLSPDYITEKRRLTPFYELCCKIMKLGNVDPKEEIVKQGNR